MRSFVRTAADAAIPPLHSRAASVVRSTYGACWDYCETNSIVATPPSRCICAVRGNHRPNARTTVNKNNGGWWERATLRKWNYDCGVEVGDTGIDAEEKRGANVHTTVEAFSLPPHRRNTLSSDAWSKNVSFFRSPNPRIRPCFQIRTPRGHFSLAAKLIGYFEASADIFWK